MIMIYQRNDNDKKTQANYLILYEMLQVVIADDETQDQHLFIEFKYDKI